MQVVPICIVACLLVVSLSGEPQGCNVYIRYFKPGETNEGCVCMEGPDPDKPNDSRLYHWSCTQCKYGPPPRYYNITATWTDQTSQSECTCVKLSFGALKVICQNAACDRRVDTSQLVTALGTCQCIVGSNQWMCS